MKMTLTPLDSPLWEVYRGAYGNVSEEVAIIAAAEKDAPPIGRLRRLDLAEKDDFHIAFDNLCENLSHQMTFYEANYLALPYILKLLSRKIAEGDFSWQVEIFSQVGCCLAADIPNENSRAFEASMPPEILASYRAAELRLQDYAKKFIINQMEGLRLLNNPTREFLLIGLLAILGNHVLANLLSFFYDNYCSLACSQCDYYDDEVYLDDPEVQSQIALPPKTAWDGHSLDKAQVWLPALLEKFGGTTLLDPNLVPYFFGEYTCPICGHKAPLLDFAEQIYLD